MTPKVSAPVVVIAASGTGGHIYPGLAVAAEIRRMRPDASVAFLTTRRGLGLELLSRAGERLFLMDGQPAPMGLSPRIAGAAFSVVRGAAQAWRHLRRLGAHVLFATGGYGAVPAALGARAAGLPIVWHEQNVLPGRATRLLCRMANHLALGFEEARSYLPRAAGQRARVTGNPVRREIVTAGRAEGARRLGLDPARRTVLVVGASQGARRLNEAVTEAAGELAALAGRTQVLVSTGAAHFPQVAGQLARRWPEGRLLDDRFELGQLRVVPYLTDMAAALAASDLVVSRAGAISIAEFTARGLPMVLVPYPYAAEGHQEKNAQALARAGAAVVVADARLTGRKLCEVVGQLLQDPQRLASMAEASRRLARPDAAEELARTILRAAEAGR